MEIDLINIWLDTYYLKKRDVQTQVNYLKDIVHYRRVPKQQMKFESDLNQAQKNLELLKRKIVQLENQKKQIQQQTGVLMMKPESESKRPPGTKTVAMCLPKVWEQWMRTGEYKLSNMQRSQLAECAGCKDRRSVYIIRTRSHRNLGDIICRNYKLPLVRGKGMFQ